MKGYLVSLLVFAYYHWSYFDKYHVGPWSAMQEIPP